MWKSLAPSRVAFFFFALEAANEAILTGDSLRIRCKLYVNWCFMCNGNESLAASLPSGDGVVESVVLSF